MWEAAFEPSMLDGNVIISCPDKELVAELMRILGEHEIMWAMHTRVVPDGDDCWSDNREMTCYRICDKYMSYGSKSFYEEDAFQDYVRCTFCGVDTSDFETATDDELMTFLGIGGG